MTRISIVAVAALSLAGCAGGAPSAGGIKDVQNAAVQICRFLPAAQTVADILLTGSMAAHTAFSIATSICNAVTINPLADGPGAKNYKPTVAGVRIKGQFIR